VNRALRLSCILRAILTRFAIAGTLPLSFELLLLNKLVLLLPLLLLQLLTAVNKLVMVTLRSLLQTTVANNVSLAFLSLSSKQVANPSLFFF